MPDCFFNVVLSQRLTKATHNPTLSCKQLFVYLISFFFLFDSSKSEKRSAFAILQSWWRHQMKTFSALLTIFAWNSPAPGEFPAQRPVTRSVSVFFDQRLNKRLSKQSWGWWFETLSRPLWRHCNDIASLKIRCAQNVIFLILKCYLRSTNRLCVDISQCDALGSQSI